MVGVVPNAPTLACPLYEFHLDELTLAWLPGELHWGAVQQSLVGARLRVVSDLGVHHATGADRAQCSRAAAYSALMQLVLQELLTLDEFGNAARLAAA